MSLDQKRRVSARTRVLGAGSVLCLPLWLAKPTLAQEARNAAPPDSFYERFYVSLEGGWLINASQDNFGFVGTLAGLEPLQPGAQGNSLGIEIGGAFNSLYDWRARWRDNIPRTSTTSGTSTTATAFSADSADEALRFQTFDGEIGYRAPGSPVRLFAGLRALKADDAVNYGYSQTTKFGTTVGSGTDEAKLFGIGPRAGFDLTTPLPDPRAFAMLDGSAAAIFTRQALTINAIETDFTGATTIVNQNLGHDFTIFNTEATALLGYRLTNNATAELGYRVQYFNGMAPAVQLDVGNPGGTVTGHSDVLVHGPLAKLTISWQ